MWVAPSIHDKYDEEYHQKRRKFTKCLEKIAHGDRNITALRLLKHVWDQRDKRLVKHKQLSPLGWRVFWDSVDNTIQNFDEKVVPAIIENKNSGKFTLQQYKEYKQASDNTRKQDEKEEGHKDRKKSWSSEYSRTHWSRNDQNNTKKSFSRNHWGNMDRKEKRKLPTPSKDV